MRRPLTIAAGIASALVLVGCASTPDVAPTAVPAPTACSVFMAGKSLPVKAAQSAYQQAWLLSDPSQRAVFMDLLVAVGDAVDAGQHVSDEDEAALTHAVRAAAYECATTTT